MAQPVTKKRRIGVEGPTITDARFTNIQSDPRYRLPGKRHRVKADRRFARALEDEDFSRKSRVDRYGRAVNADSEKQRLKRKYDFEADPEAEDDEADDDAEVQKELKKVEENRDLLREGRDVSSSSEEGSSEDDSDFESDIQDGVRLGAQQIEDVVLGDVSARLAVVNLDWDNIRAEDLMAVFTSFLPPTGRLLQVAVYPSEFGKERMEREELEGPPKEIFAARAEDGEQDLDSEEDDSEIKAQIIKPDDGSEFDSTALRQYQLDRLRYYYAVLTFSSSGTAKSIYDAVDGTEYLSTANFFDLRFVPDETDFSTDTPREQCTSIPPGYKPHDFVTDALQHSKVKLTWDAEDGGRKEAQARAFRGSRKDIDENDLKAYLASDTEDEKVEDEADDTAENSNLSKKETERQKMRALLGLSTEPTTKNKVKKDGPIGNIQVTFSSGLGGPAAVSDNDSEDGAEKTRKPKRSVFENSPELEETTMEKYVRKERERKQRRKEKLKSTRAGDDKVEEVSVAGDDNNNNNEEDLGFDDPFFAEPTNDAKSANKLRKQERLQKKKEREAEEAASAKYRAELELLMADDNDEGPGHSKGRAVQHFDMDEIVKAEKAANRKKSKKGRKSKNDTDAQEVIDNFQANTSDPRFSSLYENPEFAIDPSDPRFKNVKGMRAFVEESRRRKVRQAERHPNNDHKERKGNKHQKNSGDAIVNNDDDVSGLVEKIKMKSRKI